MFGFTRKRTLAPLIDNAFATTFDEGTRTILRGAGTTVAIAAGTTFIVEGDAGADALLILDGTAAVSRGGEVIATIAAGDIVGEMSLISQEPRTATVIATTDITAIAMTRQEFNWLRLLSRSFGPVVESLAEARA